MRRHSIISALILCMAVVAIISLMPSETRAGGRGQPTDWNRFYYYPYVYYPQTFQRPQGSYNHMYYRYPQSRRIPVYNKNWHNFYPSERPYHSGHHFILDVL